MAAAAAADRSMTCGSDDEWSLTVSVIGSSVILCGIDICYLVRIFTTTTATTAAAADSMLSKTYANRMIDRLFAVTSSRCCLVRSCW